MSRKQELLDKIRYAERLCERTARMYRHVATTSTFFASLGGGATLSALGSLLPAWVSVSGAAVMAVFGSLMLAVRPTDKAAVAEADMRRYSKLRTQAAGMDDATLETELAKTIEGNSPEVENLRAVAYNDIVNETGHPEAAYQLTLLQRVLAAIA
jgi:hypothetical protein